MLIKAFISLVFSAIAAQATVMGDLSNSMKAGEWKELVTANLTPQFLETGGGGVGIKTILEYAAKAQWDPNTGRFFFLGSGHDCSYKFVIYRDSDNTWTTGPLPLQCMTQGHNSGGCSVHSYYYSSIDVAAGKFYFMTQLQQVSEYDIAGNAWRQIPPAINDNGNKYPYYGGLAYFPERNGFFYAAQGFAYWLNKTGSQWAPLTNYSNPTYNNFALYNPVLKELLYGGGNGSRIVYRMNAGGTVQRLTDAPISVGCSNGQGNITVDPVSGNYLLYGGGSTMYQFNSQTNSWSPVSGLPPSGIRGYFTHVIAAAPVSTYGVIMYLTPSQVYLYKHSGSTAIEGRAGKTGRHLSGSPNPFRRRVIISGLPETGGALVYNLDGRKIARLSCGKGGKAVWDAQGFPKGIYLVKAAFQNKWHTQKLFLE